MKKFFLVVIVFLIGGAILMALPENNEPDETDNDTNTVTYSDQTTPQRESSSKVASGSFFQWMGASSEELIGEFGEPVRIEKSGYGYEWWTFNQDEKEYNQFGIKDGTVVTGITFSTQDKDPPFNIGEPYDKLQKKFSFKKELSLSTEGDYKLELNANDLKARPLISLNDHWTAQLYFDTFTNQLIAVRVLRNDILLKLQPYKIVYRGQLPQSQNLSNEEWEQVENGMERQVFSMTNFIRREHNAGNLTLLPKASQVAFLHSQDMETRQYFSHVSPDGNGLKERLQNGQVNYVMAGENIASQYVDAAAAIHGWLNSSGHRKTMLEKKYTHIGVGVYHRYYTQDYVTLP